MSKRAETLAKQLLDELGWHEATALKYQHKLQTVTALLEPHLVGEWLPIESAPKDGTRILVWMPLVPKSESVLAVYWDKQFEYYSAGYHGAWTDNAVQSWRDEERYSYQPTHWQHLPAPPKGEQSA